MQIQIDALQNIQPDLVAEDVNAASLTDADVKVSALQTQLTGSEILADFFETGNVSDRDDKVMDVSMTWEKSQWNVPENLTFYLHRRFLKNFPCFQQMAR